MNSPSPSRRTLLKGLTCYCAGLALGRSSEVGAVPATPPPSGTETGLSPASELRLNLGPAQPFSWEELVEEARAQATRPYQPPLVAQPELIDRIDWAAHGQIHFKPEQALFAHGPGTWPVEFFHPGKFFPVPVHMYELRPPDPSSAQLQAREILYDPNLFDVPESSPARALGPHSGFAGFKLQENRHGAPPLPDWRSNDWAAFLGASYFRAIGDEFQYGLSARAVAVNVAAKGHKEEFPLFTRFYFQPDPRPGGNPPVLYAYLDSPSLCGVYRFELERDQRVRMTVQARLFLREQIAQLGLAPITSMYWFGKADRPRGMDWRPEVHDSDGLALWTGSGEHVWRPLNNPAEKVLSSVFLDRNPRGFGLLQRERRFDHYLDAVHYERRPGLWVEPLSDWGAGQVTLVEIPTREELYDNLVAFWTPATPARAGSALALDYRLYWQRAEPFELPLARCVATRVGRGGESGPPRPPGVEKYVVEFHGPSLNLPAGARPEAVLTTPTTLAKQSTGPANQAAHPQSNPAVNASGVYVEAIPDSDPQHWRVVFDYPIPTGDEPQDLRLFLRWGDQTLSETWLYQVLPSVLRGPDFGS